MKFRFIKIAFIISAIFSTLNSLGQDNAGRAAESRVNMNASAEIIRNNIELETISDIQITEAQRLQNSQEFYINPVFDAESGLMRAKGQANAQIRISFLPEMEIARREGPGILFFRYEVSGSVEENQQESELFDVIERVVTLSDTGEFYFWIGGTVDLSQALPGTYDGEFTIEIEYI